MSDLLKFFSQTADGVFAVDDQQRIILWNEAACDLLGYTSDEVLGQPCYELIQGCDHKGGMVCQEHCRVSAAVRAGKTVTNYDVVTHTKSGQSRWINITILTLSISDPLPSSVIIHLFRDVGQAKQKEQVVDQLLDMLQQRHPAMIPSAPVPPPQPSIEPLTPREHEILVLLGQGLSTIDIAQALSISPTTVRNHIQNILHKLQVHSRLEAVTYAFEQGLIGHE